MSEYFSYFPTTIYANTQCVDILRRTVVRAGVVSDPRVYLPYELKSGERIDQVAARYYGSPDDHWLVNFSAGLTDPYHDWYLSEADFQSHITVKYGSWERASERTRHWAVNWHETDTEISVSAWSILDSELKKYYEPVFGRQSDILSYKRRTDDWTVATNMVVKVTVNTHSNAAFEVGEQVEVFTGPTLSGEAHVAWSNSSALQLIHISANTDPANTIRGKDSSANATILTRTYVSNTIPIDERPFWSAVSYLDWERDLNEAKKSIRLIDNKYKLDMQEELKRLLND